MAIRHHSQPRQRQQQQGEAGEQASLAQALAGDADVRGVAAQAHRRSRGRFSGLDAVTWTSRSGLDQ